MDSISDRILQVHSIFSENFFQSKNTVTLKILQATNKQPLKIKWKHICIFCDTAVYREVSYFSLWGLQNCDFTIRKIMRFQH